jgi:hypothetical protein
VRIFSRKVVFSWANSHRSHGFMGSSLLEYSNYIPTQARATFADVPGLEVHGMVLRLSTSTHPHGLPKASIHMAVCSPLLLIATSRPQQPLVVTV